MSHSFGIHRHKTVHQKVNQKGLEKTAPTSLPGLWYKLNDLVRSWRVSGEIVGHLRHFTQFFVGLSTKTTAVIKLLFLLGRKASVHS